MAGMLIPLNKPINIETTMNARNAFNFAHAIKTTSKMIPIRRMIKDISPRLSDKDRQHVYVSGFEFYVFGFVGDFAFWSYLAYLI